MNVGTYCKKPVKVQAARFETNNDPYNKHLQDLMEWVNDNGGQAWHDGTSLRIKTLEGEMFATVGDYIIRGVKGEFYPCKPEVFALTYTEVLA